MAINPIALQVRPVDTKGAINTLATIRQMQAADQQRQMNQLAMEDAQRKRSSEEAFKNALMTGDYKTPAGMNRLMGIDPTSALALQKNLLDQETARKSALKTDLELFSKAAGGMPDTAENYSFLYKGAVGDNPALASFLPDPSQYKTGLMTQFAVGAETLFKRATTEAANQARLDAAARTAAGRVQAAQIQAGAPQRPFQIGSNLVSAAGDVLYSGDEEKPITDWKEQRSPDGTLQYFSPSTGKTVSSTGLPTKGMGGAAGGKTSTQIAKDEAASGAIDNLNLIFDKIGPAYEELARENAISDPDKGVWYNVIAAAKSSETGKALGQAVGSKAAQARNEIDVLTTAFISQLSKATGLTASQLNSNLEFQTFRRMLESKDIVTARESIDLLRGMFAKRIPSNPKEVTQTFGAVNRQMEKSKESPESGEAQNRPSLQSIFE